MANKVLAIGIPAYNAEAYLDRCIPTFIHEELKGRIEVIIVNDGSKDRTQEIAEKYRDAYPDLVRVINKENGGHGSAVNAALYATDAKYYKVVDADDWVDTKSLIKLVDHLETCESDLVSNAYHTIDMVTGESRAQNNYGVEYGREYALAELDMGKIYISIHAATYRTALLQDHAIRLQEKTFYVDVEYQLLPFPYVRTLTFYDDFVYKYMIGNANQSVNLENFVKRYDDHNRVVLRILGFLKTAELDPPQREYVYSVFEKVLYTHYALSSIYDTDQERGRRRSLEFDRRLKEENQELYALMGKKYSNIRRMRRRSFAPGSGKMSRLRKIIGIFR